VLVNWPLKVLAIALAFAIWVFVSGEARIVQDFEAPLDVQVPDHLALLESPRTSVSVRLRGPEGLIRRIQPGGMAVGVQLGDLQTGEQLVQLSNADLSGVPRGVEVDFIEPNPVAVRLDNRDRKKFRLDVGFLGQPPEGYSFYGAQVIPEELTLEGPRTLLAELDQLETNPVRLDQRIEPFTTTVRLTSGSPLLQVVESGSIEVRVVVDMAPVERTFTGADRSDPLGSPGAPGEPASGTVAARRGHRRPDSVRPAATDSGATRSGGCAGGGDLANLDEDRRSPRGVRAGLGSEAALSKRLFGTDGIRAVAGEEPLDPSTVRRFGAALAQRLGGPRIVLGRDTRESGPWLRDALTAGCAAQGGEAVDAGVVTTPGLAWIVRHGGFDAGVMISASHNPFADNGLKAFDRDGCKLGDDVEREIESLILDQGIADPGANGASPSVDVSGVDGYIEHLLGTTGARRLDGLSIALDCANGAACRAGARRRCRSLPGGGSTGTRGRWRRDPLHHRPASEA
jgi:hypothetical protein